MNDKELKELNKFKSRSIIKQEKIEKIRQLIDDFEKDPDADDVLTMRILIDEIKKTLEKWH